MQFKIGKSTVDMEFATPTDFTAVASALLDHPDVSAELSTFAASFHFRAWERDGDIDQSTLDKIMQIALEDGAEKAEDYMIENNYDANPSEYFRACDGARTTTKFVSGFVNSFADHYGFDESSADFEALNEAVVEQASELVEEKMSDTDKSKPADYFGRMDEVKVAFIQGLGSRGYLDDIYSSHADTTCQSDTVKPDAGLMLQFKLLNISPVEFVEFYKEKRGYDLANPELGEGVSDYHRRQFLENAQAWRYACAVSRGEPLADIEIPDWLSYGSRATEMAEIIRSGRDLDRPSAVSVETLETILDNSSYGGVGTWYGRVKAREIMEGQFESGFIATGGQIGIHDFINGSGYLASVENDVVIDFRDGKLIQEDRYSYGPESVYGFTRRATDTETKGVKLDECVRYDEERWRTVTPREDGRYVNIDLVGGADGDRKVFYISTMNANNEPDGPSEEVCCTVAEAKSHAADALKEWVYEKAAEAAPAPKL